MQGNGKRSLDGLIGHLVDQVALTGEYGEFGFVVLEFFASKQNVYIRMGLGWVVHVVAAFVVALAYSSQNTRKVMFSQRYALKFTIPENMIQQHRS